MTFDAKTEKAVARVTEQARQAFGAELACLALYGSAAGEDFVPGRSDLNVVIVFEHLTFAHLQTLHRYLPQWHKLGVATPLLLDRPFLERARDVFPMEFHDIKMQHRVLYGEEVFAGLAIDERHLRYQAEHEAHGKLLRLRTLYAEVGAERKRLEGLMLDSVKTFVIIMRNFIRLRTQRSHARYLEVLEHFERHAEATFPTTRHLLRVRLGLERWTDGIDAVFVAYLGEVERLVELVDRVAPEADGSAPAAAR